MAIQTTNITASDGLKLYVRIWGEPATSKAIIILVHGIGEHCQRYEYVARKFNERNFCLVGFDQRGCGLSQGKQGLIGKKGQLIGDVAQFAGYARGLNPNIPAFAYGHSQGALEVLDYALKYKPELAGVIATSPPLDPSTLSPIQKFMVRMLNPILPNLVVSSGLKAENLSRDPLIVENYRHDPLVHDKASVRLGAYLQDTPGWIMENAHEWRLPLYLAHGTSDRICPISGSDNFISKLQGDVTYRRWKGLFHETHNEPEKDLVIGTMLDWAESKL